MKTKTSSKKVPTLFSRQSTSRSFPLGSILILVALTSCCTIQPGTELVCNTLAPDCTYEQIGGYFGIQNAAAGTAAKFTAETSGNLATVYLGLTKQSLDEGGGVNVFLCPDAAGSPKMNIATQTYLGTVASTKQAGTTNNSVVSLVVAGKVPVSQGLDYWLVLKPAAPGTYAVWNLSLGRRRQNGWVTDPVYVGSIAVWGYRGPWRTFNDHWLPAFAITAWPRPWANLFRERESPFRVPEWQVWPPPWPPPHDLPRPN